MSSPIIVTSSTSVISIDSTRYLGDIPVLLPNIYPFTQTITVRDATGAVSTNRRIIVSTTKGISIQDGASSNIISQPYGFLTFRSRTENSYIILNEFSYPDQSKAAFVKYVTADTIYASTVLISSLQVNTLGIFSTNLTLAGSTLIQGHIKSKAGKTTSRH